MGTHAVQVAKTFAANVPAPFTRQIAGMHLASPRDGDLSYLKELDVSPDAVCASSVRARYSKPRR